MRKRLFSAMALILVSGGLAQAEDVPGGGETSDSALCRAIKTTCAQGYDNCLKAIREIPNKTAIRFTLAYLRDNTGTLADSSCAKPGTPKGIQNTDSFVLNDLQSTQKAPKSKGYFIDLCASQTVQSFPLNKGVGTTQKGNGYLDREGKNTTLVGAFLTGTRTEDFTPFSDRRGLYRQLRKQYGAAQKLMLYGVNESNNDTAKGKPFHESPLQSSWGCPSIPPGHRQVMQSLAAKGPSLFMNYGPESYHRSTTECTNDEAPSSGKKKKGSGSRNGGSSDGGQK